MSADTYLNTQDLLKELDSLRQLNAELLQVLEGLMSSLYNGFEPDNQSAAYLRAEAVIQKAREAKK